MTGHQPPDEGRGHRVRLPALQVLRQDRGGHLLQPGLRLLQRDRPQADQVPSHTHVLLIVFRQFVEILRQCFLRQPCAPRYSSTRGSDYKDTHPPSLPIPL